VASTADMAAWAEDLGEAAVEQEALLVATGMDCSMAGVGMGAVMKEKMAMMGEVAVTPAAGKRATAGA